MGRGEGSVSQRKINYINSLIFNERRQYYLKLTNQETHVLSEFFKAIMPFAATQMDLEMIILSEVSQTKTNIIWHHLYVESKKNWYKWTYL